MTDLYAHLSIPRDADLATIRRAYRKRSKMDHPDTPSGSPAKFALTKLAHDILTDAARRAKYDSTGDTSETTPDNSQAQLLEVIAALLNQTLDNCAKHGVDPLTINLAREIESLAANAIREFRTQRAQIAKLLPVAKSLLGRFKRKKRKDAPSDSPNILEALAQSRVNSIQSTLAQIDLKISNFEAAISLIKDYDFEADLMRPQAQQTPWVRINVFGGPTAGSGTGW